MLSNSNHVKYIVLKWGVCYYNRNVWNYCYSFLPDKQWISLELSNKLKSITIIIYILYMPIFCIYLFSYFISACSPEYCSFHGKCFVERDKRLCKWVSFHTILKGNYIYSFIKMFSHSSRFFDTKTASCFPYYHLNNWVITKCTLHLNDLKYRISTPCIILYYIYYRIHYLKVQYYVVGKKILLEYLNYKMLNWEKNSTANGV